MKTLTLIFSLFILTGCNEVTDINIPGTYRQDKSITAPGKSKPAVEDLTLLENHTFTLASKDGSTKSITGEWQVKDSGSGEASSGGSEAQAVVLFTYDGKTTIGELRANILQFRAPYGFHPETFEYVLYVKANDK
ncbi:hypothetical protein AAEO56_07595 [Flavobacterium sp. DGU11]|uniref:Lipocalin-like domain-containing protein n=1 Tax=Flavobacterium arundinis TaxID=3139143 RepID=A0ABU9HX61_9FLAO